MVRASIKQVEIASSFSRIPASPVLHSFIATFTGSNITKYAGLNTIIIIYERAKHNKIHQFIIPHFIAQCNKVWCKPGIDGYNTCPDQ